MLSTALFAENALLTSIVMLLIIMFVLRLLMFGLYLLLINVSIVDLTAEKKKKSIAALAVFSFRNWKNISRFYRAYPRRRKMERKMRKKHERKKRTEIKKKKEL